MKRLLLIIYTIGIWCWCISLLPSCQKEITCEDWDVCPGKLPKYKGVQVTKFVMPGGNIDPWPYTMFTNVQGPPYFHFFIMPQKADTVSTNCLLIKLKDSAGYYKVVDTMTYVYGNNRTPAIQLGGTDSTGWGSANPDIIQYWDSTYHLLCPEGVIDTVKKGYYSFKPNWGNCQ